MLSPLIQIPWFLQTNQTPSDDEDSDSEPGWLISNERHYGITGAWTSASNSLRIAILGHDSPSPSPSPRLQPRLTRKSTPVLGPTNQDRRRYAQTFSAANNADGTQAKFDFEGLTFQLSGSDIGNVAASHLVVTVNADNSGEPGSVLYTLTSATTSLSLHIDDRPRVHVQRTSRRHPDVRRYLLARFRSSARFRLL